MTTPHILVANVFFAPFSYGGATVVAEEIAHDLMARGAAQVSVVSLISRSELAPYTIVRAQNSGIDNYLINVPQGRPFMHHYDNPKIGQLFDTLIADLSPDVMHVHCIQEIGVDILRAANRAKVPIILSVHDFWWICERQFMVRVDQTYCGQNPVRIEACKGCVPDWDASKRRQETLLKVAGFADIITYPSQFARNLCEASGLAPGKGVVWENGVQLPKPDFARLQANRRANDARLVFGFVGGPSQIKGWPIIREAFKNMGKDFGRSDFCVHVVDGSLDGSWWRDQDLSDLPGEWRIIPRFSQSDMDGFYAGIDVLLFMSQWKETFGLAIREALARGLDVIQTDSGGTTEHGGVAHQKLIPIGAASDVLVSQLAHAFKAHPQAAKSPIPITSFTQQAKELEGLVARCFARETV